VVVDALTVGWLKRSLHYGSFNSAGQYTKIGWKVKRGKKGGFYPIFAQRFPILVSFGETIGGYMSDIHQYGTHRREHVWYRPSRKEEIDESSANMVCFVTGYGSCHSGRWLWERSGPDPAPCQLSAGNREQSRQLLIPGNSHSECDGDGTVFLVKLRITGNRESFIGSGLGNSSGPDFRQQQCRSI
jgi:hypothetical protein